MNTATARLVRPGPKRCRQDGGTTGRNAVNRPLRNLAVRKAPIRTPRSLSGSQPILRITWCEYAKWGHEQLADHPRVGGGLAERLAQKYRQHHKCGHARGDHGDRAGEERGVCDLSAVDPLEPRPTTARPFFRALVEIGDGVAHHAAFEFGGRRPPAELTKATPLAPPRNRGKYFSRMKASAA